MEIAAIQKALGGFLDALTSQTYLGTYKETTRSSLLKEGLSTRANSIWKMAEYIIATYDNDDSTPLQNYLDGWSKLAKNYGNQYLIIATDKSNWQMYDSQGLLLGDNEYIKGLGKKKRASADSLSTAGEQTIYYGCPGTGKSFEVKMIAEGKRGKKIIWYDKPTEEHPGGLKREEEPTDEEKKKLDNNIFRTTFHPDYDYATFVGCYKPGKNADGKLDYRFIPQVFTNAYISALRHPDDPTYLIIEEINRGNCAQIFGDLFQLLDRTNGVSDYEIKPDAELARYLASEGVPSESLSLPDNLHIYATMNTSDQSLFPMDSAFKRRWAMEYKPIDYKHGKAMKFTVTIDNEEYPWIGFLQMVNEMILNATDSEDKQMGEFFIKGSVTEKEFINKVMFYLWNDVCKDLYNPRRVQAPYFLRVKKQLENEKNDYFTFAELFSERNEGSRLLKEFIPYLEDKFKESHKDIKLTEDKRIDWKSILEETEPTPGTIEG